MLFAQRVGFSGTPSSLLPTELQPCHFERCSEGRVPQSLKSTGVAFFVFFPIGKPKPKTLLLAGF